MVPLSKLLHLVTLNKIHPCLNHLDTHETFPCKFGQKPIIVIHPFDHALGFVSMFLPLMLWPFWDQDQVLSVCQSHTWITSEP